jgi:phosphoglycerate dehydrogenase-like enzyme
MNILVTIPVGKIRNSFIPEELRLRMETLGKVIWNEGTKQFNAEELREHLRDVDICITGWGTQTFNRQVLSAADKLKLIAHTGGTVAPIVSSYLYDSGIRVISGNQIYAESVAEGVIAYFLASLRDIPFYSNEVEENRWSEDDSPSEGLLGQTIGLVGFGMITKHLLEMLKPFHVRIKIYSSHISDEELEYYGIQKAGLEEIFSESKIISLHSSQRPETYHMIDSDLLSLIPDNALLVNTARGSLINEVSLEDELLKNRFKAVLDVFEKEPLPAESRLRGLRNVMLIPHMCGPTYDRREIVTSNLIDDIERFIINEKLEYEISKEYSGYMTIE